MNTELCTLQETSVESKKMNVVTIGGIEFRVFPEKEGIRSDSAFLGGVVNIAQSTQSHVVQASLPVRVMAGNCRHYMGQIIRYVISQEGPDYNHFIVCVCRADGSNEDVPVGENSLREANPDQDIEIVYEGPATVAGRSYQVALKMWNLLTHGVFPFPSGEQQLDRYKVKIVP